MMTPSGAAKARVRQETTLLDSDAILCLITIYLFYDARAHSRARAFSLAFFSRETPRKKVIPFAGEGEACLEGGFCNEYEFWYRYP